MSGWIKAHRALCSWEWYKDANTFRVFFHLLLNANYHPSRYMGVLVPIGSLPTGRNAIAAALGITPDQVRTALDHLKETQEITQQAFPKFSIITITNWKSYQEEPQQIPSLSPAHPQQVPTLKEEKKERKSRDAHQVTLAEWEKKNGELTLEHVPKHVETYGAKLAEEHLSQFRNSCEAKGRKYVNFPKALQSWKWGEPPKKEAASWVKVQG